MIRRPRSLPPSPRRNTIVLLAPDVDIDFSDVVSPDGADSPLIVLKRCVTLASYEPQSSTTQIARQKAATAPASTATGISSIGVQSAPGSGRTPHSLGPVLCYGSNAKRDSGAVFIEAPCPGGTTDPNSGEGARILGFCLFGPNFNDHFTSEKGINIRGCQDLEIGNMEIAGWGAPPSTLTTPTISTAFLPRSPTQS